MAELNLNTTVYQLTLTQSGDVVNLTLSSTSVTLELVAGGISDAYLAQKLTKENVSGLKITDSPEFASLQSTALQPEADGGQIPDADYSWFKGLFTSLQDKLIFSWIYGLISLVKDAMTRIGLLEDKYILKYVVPADCTEIELIQDKYGNTFNFEEGDEVEVTLEGSGTNSTLGGVIYLQLNDVKSYEYYYNITSKYVGFFSYISPIVMLHWRLVLDNNCVQALVSSNRMLEDQSQWQATVLSLFSMPVSLGGLISFPINKISFTVASGVLKAGSVIIIKKL